MIKIENINIKVMVDESPDTSFLGEYTDEWESWVIVRKYDDYLENLPDETEIPLRGRHCRFFKPYAGGEKPGSKNYQKYGMDDYRRMEGLARGDWCFYGIMAEAEVSYPVGQGSRRLETLTSGGLWGVESDSGDYLRQVADEELADLSLHLETFGVDMSNFDELAEEALDKADI
jgi:hypothetical protein